MLSMPPGESVRDTHEVLNQPPPLAGYNAFDADPALQEALHREGAGWAEARCRELGAAVGSPEVIAWAHQANRYLPELRTHDRFGRRIDRVDFHPAWHELMRLAYGSEVHSLAWTARRPGAHAARAALSYLWNQAENGVGCPTGMSYASVAALRHQPELAAEWEPRFTAADYDPRFVPAAEKTACTVGMAMTEKQGGSDVRANTTRAAPAGSGGPGGEYLLTGHKWFCSAPMSDAFLTLAYTEDGICCFLVPRWRPDGTQNRFLIQRLKDKCGNRSNASSEIEYDGTWARMVGEPGRGVRTIIEMAHLTRIDFAVGSAGLMRHALAQTVNHTRHRRAFQKPLIDQPLMGNVVADLAVESEAALHFTLRIAAAFDRAEDSEHEALISRIATPVAKYWICKRAPMLVAEALECHGGNGFIEEAPLARLYREAPLNGIWEGTGNVICLDVLRAMDRAPGSAEALLAEVRQARGADRRLDAAVDRLADEIGDRSQPEARARRLVELMALTLQGALMVRHAPPALADAFCAGRLGGEGGLAFGTLPAGVDARAIADRAFAA